MCFTKPYFWIKKKCQGQFTVKSSINKRINKWEKIINDIMGQQMATIGAKTYKYNLFCILM